MIAGIVHALHPGLNILTIVPHFVGFPLRSSLCQSTHGAALVLSVVDNEIRSSGFGLLWQLSVSPVS